MSAVENLRLLPLPSSELALRPYQLRVIHQALRCIAEGKKAPLIVMPTGTGKMIVAAEIMKRAVSKGNTVLFAVHRREMVKQCSEKLTALGVEHALILPGHKPGNLHRAYAGTVQSMTARLRGETFNPLNVRVIVIDEAHHATSQTYRDLRAAFPRAVVIGVTATPCREDGEGLGNVFDGMVQGITYSEAFDQGYLVPPRYFAPYQPDLSEIHSRGGDYVERELGDLMNRPKLVGDIVQHYARHAADRQGIVFASSVAHSLALTDAFNAAGFPAFHLDGSTPTEQRDELMEEFRAGDLQVFVNVGIATEGVDVPNVGAVVLARPTKSLSLYMQMVGRGLRPADGKHDCIAEGELVLTDHGLVPIERVTLGMKVWDGRSWVTHKGVVCKGVKEVITYAGLTATADHRVWTQEGWKTLGECAREQIPVAQTGLGGSAVWEGESFVTGRGVAREASEPQDVRPNRMPDVWADSLGFLQQFVTWADWGLSRLWAAAQGGKMVLPPSPGNAATLPELPKPSVLRLWRAGGSVQFSERDRGGAVDSGKSGSTQGLADRQNRQRRTLRAWQSTLGDAEREYGESKAHKEVRVWDILDCGPRHRFTVSGVLVHNCVLLDHAGNTVRLDPAETHENWTLETGTAPYKAGKRQQERDAKEVTCEKCSAIMYGTNVCPECKHIHQFERAPKHMDVREGDLVELGKGKLEYTLDERRTWYRMLLGYAHNRGMNPGWAFHKYQEKFRDEPVWGKREAPLEPSQEVMAWIQSRLIAWREEKKRDKKAMEDAMRFPASV